MCRAGGRPGANVVLPTPPGTRDRHQSVLAEEPVKVGERVGRTPSRTEPFGWRHGQRSDTCWARRRAAETTSHSLIDAAHADRHAMLDGPDRTRPARRRTRQGSPRPGRPALPYLAPTAARSLRLTSIHAAQSSSANPKTVRKDARRLPMSHGSVTSPASPSRPHLVPRSTHLLVRIQAPSQRRHRCGPSERVEGEHYGTINRACRDAAEHLHRRVEQGREHPHATDHRPRRAVVHRHRPGRVV